MGVITDAFAEIDNLDTNFNYNEALDNVIRRFVHEANIGGFDPYVKIDKNLREVTVLIYQKTSRRLDQAVITFDQLKDPALNVLDFFRAEERRNMSDEVQLSVDGFSKYTLT